MAFTYWDIETEPADAAALKEMEPEFSAPSTWKDLAKIEAAIAEKRAEWLERAALSPLSGRVLAIGYTGEASLDLEFSTGGPEGEARLISNFFDRVRDCCMGSAGKLVGFNIHDFDLPFVVKRALALNIPIPAGLLPKPGAGRFYWPPWLIDLRDIWGMGELHPHGSLDVIARFLGLGSKTGSGKDFARLYHGTTEERAQAVNYMETELRLMWRVGQRLGVGGEP